MNWSEEDFNTLVKSNPAIKVHEYGVKKVVEQVKKEKTSKYRNKKTKVDGVYFDSVKESDYFKVLQIWLKFGEILGFARQPEFLLQNGTEDMKPIIYKPDFIVIYKDHTEIIDVKGMLTDVYKIKKKMFMARYPGLKIVEKY